MVTEHRQVYKTATSDSLLHHTIDKIRDDNREIKILGHFICGIFTGRFHGILVYVTGPGSSKILKDLVV